MENIILRAMRTFDESVCAPEYARNQLAIEIIFPEPPVFINELAVRVYSEDIIRKSKFPQNPKRSVRFSGKRTKRSVQKRKARNTQKAETKVL